MHKDVDGPPARVTADNADTAAAETASPFLSAPRTSLLHSTGSRLTMHCSPLLARAKKTSTNEFGTALNSPPPTPKICVPADLQSAEKCGDNMCTGPVCGISVGLIPERRGDN